jgi:hypothetical protein
MNAVAALANVMAKPEIPHREKIAILVRGLGQFEQKECPLTHYFAPGIYLREIFMPEGAVVIGKIHKTEHLNIIERGSVSIVHDDGSTERIEAPHTFVSKPGVQKVLYIHADTVWKTIHPTNERDLDQLESLLIEPDDSYPLLDRTEERLAITRAAE